MSLINQVLTDLEKRRSREGSAAEGLLREVRTPLPRRTTGFSRIWRYFAGIGIVAALFLTAVSVMREGDLILQEPVESAAIPVSIRMPVITEPANPPAAISAIPTDRVEKAVISAPPLPGNPAMPGEASPSGTMASASLPPENIAPTITPEASEETTRRDEPPAKGAGVKPALPVATAPLPQTRPAPKGTLRVVHSMSPREEAERELRQGREALAAAQWPTAETALRRVLSLTPDSLQGRELLADLLLRLGRAGEAEEMLRQGLQLAPDHLSFVKGYAHLLAGRGAWAEAGGLLRGSEPPLLSVDPDYHALMAAVCQRQGDYAAASGIYQQLVRLRPANGTWWVGLGIALEGEAMKEKAAEAFERGLEAGGMDSELVGYARQRLAAIRK